MDDRNTGGGGRHALQTVAELQPIATRSMFWRPNCLETSAWMEHIPFAFWLIEAHRPRVLVELGTHAGTSYFAFCQAVERLGLDTRCFAVDTWKGDAHAGFYAESVFERVRAYNDAQYSGFSRLVRSTFDQALDHFSDHTVDLLHIDGLHTLEAVTHDFDSWVDKLSDRAVVVMHDTNVRERGFGVFALFERLKQRFPTFEFVHGHGLGVVGVGMEQREPMRQLFGASGTPGAEREIRDVFARLGRACADTYSAGRAEQREKELGAQVEQHKQQLADALQKVEKLSSTTREQAGRRGSAELLERLQASEQQLAAREQARQGEVAELQQRLQAAENQMAERAQAAQHEMAAARVEIEELPRQLGQRHAAESALVAGHAKETSELRAGHDADIDAVRRALAQAENSVAARFEETAKLSSMVLALEQQAEGHTVVLAAAETRCREQGLELDRLRQTLAEREAAGAEAIKQILVERESHGQALAGELDRLQQALAKREADAAEANRSHLHLKQILVERESQGQALAGELDRLQQALAKREADAAEANRSHLHLKQILTERESQRQALAGELDRLQQALAKREADAAEANRSHLHLKQILTERESQRQSLAGERDRLQQVLAEREAAAAEADRAQQTALDRQHAQLEHLEQVLAERESQLQRLLTSRSWRLTAPLRRKGREAVNGASESAMAARPLEAEAPVEAAVPSEAQAEKNLQDEALAQTLRVSGLFDEAWYLQRYPDVAADNADPVLHYLAFGAGERRDPGPHFSTSAYLDRYPDVATSAVNPLAHFVEHGHKEGRIASDAD